MKKLKSHYRNDGTGALHLDFQNPVLLGMLRKPSKRWVGFFSQSGELQGVTFDDVDEKRDHQVIGVRSISGEVSLDNGKTSHFSYLFRLQNKTFAII